MAGRIPESFIDELLSRTNIVDVVDGRVRLKKAGKNYHACCPFHNEKTPSFTVSLDKQFYYCFGCGAKGNALGFVMEFDNVDFPEAIETLAGALGMEVPREETSPFQQQQQKAKVSLYELMEAADTFYQQQLRFHQDKQAPVEYLKNRGLSGKAAKYFHIGYAPAGWDNLKAALGTDEEKTQGLIDAGMLIQKDGGGTYDRFRNRIVFPIRDLRGRTIAFGARTLGDDKPKYLNSPETPIFNKGHELYGLYECRQIRQTLKRFLVVEGYMDVVALHQFGIHYAVATLGTATSDTHLKKLFKIAPEVVFCFDGDSAGQRAAKRALEIVLPILEDGQQIRFLFLPDGEDPDSLVRKEGKDGFELRMKHALPVSDFLLNTLKEDIDHPESLDGRARLASLAAPRIAGIPGVALKSLFWQALAEATHLSTDELKGLAKDATSPHETLPSNTLSHQPPSAPSLYEDASAHKSEPAEGLDEPVRIQDTVLVQTTIGLILHAPTIIQPTGDYRYLAQLSGTYGRLLHKLVHQLQQHEQSELLGVITSLGTDPDLEHYKYLASQTNQQKGHLQLEQEARDALRHLRELVRKHDAQRSRQSLQQLGAHVRSKDIPDSILIPLKRKELSVLEDKIQKAGGLEHLPPREQAKFHELKALLG